MNKFLAAFVFLPLVVACTTSPKPAAEAPAAEAAAGVTLRGEPLKGLSEVALASLLSSPEEHAGKAVAVQGTVRKACAKKGCWMELATEGGSAVRVTFKDYGFFVPLDSAGSQAKVEGMVSVKELDDAMAKHYEEEGATVPRGADGKAREVSLVAYGVELRK